MSATNDRSPVSLSVGPNEITTYLSRSGWTKAEGGRVAEVWIPNAQRKVVQNTSYELLVPLIETAPDFEVRVEILLRNLQRLEQRPSDEIRFDISRQFVDVMDVSAEHDLDSSVFPLEASHKLFLSAKRMVVAAAAATLKRRGYFGHSVPQRARDQAKNVLVGHTKPGSYVVPVISRAFVPEAPWQGDQPRLVEEVEQAAFDRRTLVTLVRGLSVLYELAVTSDRRPTNSQIYDGVGEGLSYELCNSVLLSLRDPAVEAFDAGFKWAPAVSRPREQDEAFVFPFGAKENLSYVAQGLRRDEEDREHVIYGWVEMLSSKAEDTGGRVNVHAVVGGRHRAVRMQLDAEDYEKAVASHKRQSVVVRGDLHLEEGKQPTMDVHSFELEQQLPVT